MADKVGLKGLLVVFFVLSSLISIQGRAQNSPQSISPVVSVIAEVVGEYPYAYEQPDFDSKVIATLKPGTFYYVSKQQYPFGFHKVMLQKNQVSYVSSSEIRIVSPEYVNQKRKNRNNPKAVAEDEFKEKKMADEKSLNQKPISISRYRGLIVEQQDYTEDTMSKTRNEPLVFFGFRQLGYNTLFSGEMSTDASVLIHLGAPRYYQDITGYAATGWILNAHFTFDTIIPLGNNQMVSYGFGPMAKYSHFEAFLKNSTGSGSTSYALDDLTLGVLLRLGAGIRWGFFSIRSDLKYFIESKQYVGINISTLFVF